MSRMLALTAVLIVGLAHAAEPVPPPIIEERGKGADRLVVQAELSVQSVALSGDVRLTVTIEGPAPLRVTLPNLALNPESAAVWKVNATGTPGVEELPGGRERWRQVFRLFPYVAAESVVVHLAPLTVRGGNGPDTTIEWRNSFSVGVTTTVVQPDLTTLRPPTDIEHLPTPPSTGTDSNGFLWFLAIVLLLALGSGIYLRHRRRRQAPPLDARQRAMRDLGALAGSAGDSRAVQELADVLRRYVESRTDVSATRLTTQELLVLLRRGEQLSDERIGELQSVLEAGDFAKFAALPLSIDGADFSRLHQNAVQFIDQSFAPLPATAPSPQS